MQSLNCSERKHDPKAIARQSFTEKIRFAVKMVDGSSLLL